MRLFAAVDPPADAVQHLAATLGEPRDGRWRWTPVEQWHLTVAFYGEVPDAGVDALTDRLARAAARSAALTLRLAGMGTFPRQSGRARVLWCGVTGDVDDLSRLADRAVAAGRRCGITMEDRRFRGHLTLARSRGQSADATTLLASSASYAGPAWRVSDLRLVRSHLGSAARHETVARWPLGEPVS